ncbi:MAG: lamin tail domain-containing protein [Cyclobacteriaceae bacterium]|jgi:hypothetical protein
MKKIYQITFVLAITTITLFNGQAFGQLIINEVHADPEGTILGDANGDGVRDTNQDEFIEFVNTGATALDISGWKIFDSNSTLLLRHTFPASTIVPPGKAIVVFGGGTPTGSFGRAIVQVASSGALGLTNTSETITVEDDIATPMISLTWGAEANGDQSITRDPDITGSDSPLVQHSTIASAAGALYSPGTRNDGSQFGLIVHEIHADPASDISGDANGDGVRSASDDEFIELVNNGASDLDISGWKIFDSNSSVIERHVFPASTIVPAGKAIVVFGGGTPTGNFGGSIVQVASTGALALTNTSETVIVEDNAGNQVISFTYGAEADNNQSITRDPDITGTDTPFVAHSSASGSGGTLFSPGLRTDRTKFADPAMGLVINEIHADPEGTILGDANGDGVRDANQDEFIELVNARTTELDISGWKIFDSNSSVLERHVFPASTIIPAGGAIVVFGGGTPTGSFGGSIVQTASTGGLGLTNTSETIIIEDNMANSVISYAYGAEANADQSIVRDPDFFGSDNPMIGHIAATGSAGARYSPGVKIDGTPFLAPAATIVELASAAASVNEGVGTVTVSVSIVGQSDTNPTSVSLVLISGSASDINNYTTQVITFPAASSAAQEVVITVTDDADVEADEVFTFQLQNVSGGDAAVIGAADSFELTIQDNDFAVSSVIINEYMAWPAGADATANGPVVDSNGDGAADIAEDEFIEFVNNGNVDVDMSGWKIYDSNTQFLLRHTFPGGTVLNPGGALVVFGGGNPTGEFGGALVQLCSTGNLGMTNTSDVMVIRNQSDETVIELTYGAQTRGTSITFNPDVTGAIGPHPQLNGLNISPGTKVDGTPFAVATRTSVQFESLSGSLAEDAGTFEIPISIIRENATNPTTAEVVITTTGFEGDINFTTQLITFPAGSAAAQIVTVEVINDELLEGDELFQFQIQNVSGGTSAVAGNPATFEFMVNDDDVPLIFNEIHADPANGIAGDANNDGIRDPAGDEFIEIVNRSLEDVDLSGWTFHDASQLRHTFPDGTIIQPGRALVVFGGGIPTGTFGGTEVQLASDPDGLGLTNTGDQITIFNESSEIMAGTTYGSLADNNQSITRDPDITGGLVQHSTIPAANGKLYSPGFKNNGGLFINIVTGFEESASHYVTVHPNPATNYVTVTLDKKMNASFVMYDNMARPVRNMEVVEKETEVEVGSLPRGIYFYKLIQSDNAAMISVGKLIIR